MKVVVITHSLELGGIGKVISDLTTEFVDCGWVTSIICISVANSAGHYPISTEVPVIVFDATNLASRSFKRWLTYPRVIRRLRTTLNEIQPDLIISFMDWINVLSLLASIGMTHRVVVSERGNPARRELAWPWRPLRRLLYPRADALVAVSRGVLAYFNSYSISTKRVIPGGVTLPSEIQLNKWRQSEPNRKKRIITLSRFEHEKGLDLAIRAFALISPEFPDWEFTIWGEGSLRASLEQLSRDLSMETKIRMPGITSQPMRELAVADICALSSRSEGHPNILTEALACGVPCVSFDCDMGPREIISHNMDGFLVPPGDFLALSEALKQLIVDADLRVRFAKSARANSTRFSDEKIFNQWKEVIENC